MLVKDIGPSDAPVIMLSNSLGTNHRMWDEVASILSKTHRVICYDTRGHGGSIADGSVCDIADLAVDAIAILDELRIQKVHFAGLSLGGMTGQVLGADYPARLASLSLLATSAYMPPPSAWIVRAAKVRDEGTGAIMAATLERWFTPGFRHSNANEVKLIADIFSHIDRDGYAVCCEAIARMDLRNRTQDIRVPTLVIAGANDIATPVLMAEDLVNGIAGSQLVVLEPAAHLLAVEQPQAVAHHVLSHVERHAFQGALCS